MDSSNQSIEFWMRKAGQLEIDLAKVVDRNLWLEKALEQATAIIDQTKAHIDAAILIAEQLKKGE